MGTETAKTMRKIAYIRSGCIYNDSRSTKEISALVEHGYKVTVYGWDRTGDALSQCEDVFSAYEDSIQFCFFPYPLPKGIGLKNFLKLLKWFRWIKKCLSEGGPFDAIHACDLDAALGIWRYAKKNNIKLVYDIYDYYVDCHYIPKCIRAWVEKQEITVINNADATIICTEERREQIQTAKPRKLIVIHNSPDVQSQPPHNYIYDYVYCGVMRDKRLIHEILNTYKSNDDLKFAYVGRGTYAQQAEELSSEFENFHYIETLPYHKVLNLEAQGIVISAIYEPSLRNHRLCAPNKFYEALALGKPVIVCKGTGIDKIVERESIGIVIDYDASQFYNGIRQLIANKEETLAMGRRARKLYEELYTWSHMKRRLLEMYKKILDC